MVGWVDRAERYVLWKLGPVFGFGFGQRTGRNEGRDYEGDFEGEADWGKRAGG